MGGEAGVGRAADEEAGLVGVAVGPGQLDLGAAHDRARHAGEIGRGGAAAQAGGKGNRRRPVRVGTRGGQEAIAVEGVAIEPGEHAAQHVVLVGRSEGMRAAAGGRGPGADRRFTLVGQGPDDGHVIGIGIEQPALHGGTDIGDGSRRGRPQPRAGPGRAEARIEIHGKAVLAVGIGLPLDQRRAVGGDVDGAVVLVEFDQRQPPVTAVGALLEVGENLEDVLAGIVLRDGVGLPVPVPAEDHEDLRVALDDGVEDVVAVGRAPSAGVEILMGAEDGRDAGIRVEHALRPGDHLGRVAVIGRGTVVLDDQVQILPAAGAEAVVMVAPVGRVAAIPELANVAGRPKKADVIRGIVIRCQATVVIVVAQHHAVGLVGIGVESVHRAVGPVPLGQVAAVLYDVADMGHQGDVLRHTVVHHPLGLVDEVDDIGGTVAVVLGVGNQHHREGIHRSGDGTCGQPG